MSQPLPHILLDSHLDIAMNYVAYGRDFRLGSWAKQRREGKFPGHPFDGIGVASVGQPDLLLGRTGIVFASLWTPPKGAPFCPPNIMYETPRQAYQQALRQWDYYQRLADQHDNIRLIRFQHELQTVLESWADDQDMLQHKVGLVLQMEGADPILEPKQVEEWVERGVRIIAPAWRATRYSAGTGAPGRLTPLGRELLEQMSHYGLILDLSHMAEAAYFECIDRYEGALIATHSNPRRFVASDRQLSDDMIRALAERDGVIGIVPFNEFLLEGWKSWTGRKEKVHIRRMLDAIDHVCQVTGSARHVGIGTDWDGGFGWESIPIPFDSHIDLWKIESYLTRRDYSPADVRNILCGNFLRILGASLPV
jgi:membrane dipeptidase